MPAPKSKPQASRKLRHKFDEHIKCKNFYEAHQMCNTMLFRFSNGGNYQDAFDLLTYSANVFIDHEVLHSAYDLLHSFVNLLAKAYQFSNSTRVEQFAHLLSRLPSNISAEDSESRSAVINSAIKLSKTEKEPRGSPTLHFHLAKLYEEEFDIQRARYHFIFSDSPKSCARFCVKISHAGLESEVALFATQAVLQYLVVEAVEYAKVFLQTYIHYHPKVTVKRPPFELPLLNFCFYLLASIADGKIDSYLRLTSCYEKSLRRDPSFAVCLEKIGAKFFGLKVPKNLNKSGGIMGLLDTLLESMGGDMDGPPAELSACSSLGGERGECSDEGGIDGSLVRDSKRIKISDDSDDNKNTSHIKIEAADLD